MYSLSVTLSLRPESLSPILNNESPNLSTSRCKLSSFTYFDLPLIVRRPRLRNALNDARLMSHLVALDELLGGQVIHMHAFDVVDEVLRYFAHFILLEEVAVL